MELITRDVVFNGATAFIEEPAWTVADLPLKWEGMVMLKTVKAYSNRKVQF